MSGISSPILGVRVLYIDVVVPMVGTFGTDGWYPICGLNCGFAKHSMTLSRASWTISRETVFYLRLLAHLWARFCFLGRRPHTGPKGVRRASAEGNHDPSAASSWMVPLTQAGLKETGTSAYHLRKLR